MREGFGDREDMILPSFLLPPILAEVGSVNRPPLKIGHTNARVAPCILYMSDSLLLDYHNNASRQLAIFKNSFIYSAPRIAKGLSPKANT